MNTQTIDFTRVASDINGNSRYVCHFLAFITDEDSLKAHSEQGMNAINYLYSLALKRSRQLGGKKYHNKQYGGGILFQMYSGQFESMTKSINEIINQTN